MTRYWTINGRFLTQPLSGVQRYAHEIVRALDELLSESHPLAQGLSVSLVHPAGASKVPSLGSIHCREAGRFGGHLWEQLSLPRHVTGGLLSLGNAGPLAVGKQIICIHDLNTRLFPASYSRPFRALYRVLIPALGMRAARIATVSHFSAHELVRLKIAREKKISVIPNGHEHAGRWQPQHSATTQNAAGRNTILVIGSRAPHKNTELLLNMTDKLEDAGLRLAIAGMSDARVFSDVAANTSARNVIWLGKVSDDELAALFQDCLCLAFPSFTEGFGLPAVEAMSWGCPVVASDRASLPEICADAALYAPPTDAQAWLDHFVNLSRDENLRNALAVRGRANIQRYRWRSSAALYLQLMAELDGLNVADMFPVAPEVRSRPPSPSAKEAEPRSNLET